MKINSLAKPIVAAAFAVIAWYPTVGMAQDASLATYRCYLGETSQCQHSAPTPEVRIEKRLVLGPYARYLAYLGESEAAAALKAQSVGEYAVERTVRITKRDLGEREKYERVLAGSPASDFAEATLSEVAVDVRDQRIAALPSN